MTRQGFVRYLLVSVTVFLGAAIVFVDRREHRLIQGQADALTTYERQTLETARLTQKLFDAASSGDADKIPELARQGADFLYHSRTSGSPILIAISAGDRQTVAQLLAHGVDINSKYPLPDSRGGVMTLLRHALQHRQLAIAEFLVQQGANIDTAVDQEGTLLNRAILNDKLAQVEWLLCHGADTEARNSRGDTPLQHAVRYRKFESAKLLIDRDADTGALDRRGETVFQLAFDHPDILQSLTELLKMGIDPEIRDRNGHTLPQSMAASSRRFGVYSSGKGRRGIELWLRYSPSSLHRWPLQWIIDMDDMQLLERRLSTAGPELDAALAYGVTRKNSGPIIELLLAYGAQKDVVNAHGKSPLGLAVEHKNWAAAELLSTRKSIHTLSGRQRLALFMAAITNGYEKSLQLMADEGLDIDAPLGPRKTRPIFEAIRKKNRRAVEQLIHYGVDLSVRDSDQRTPLIYAASVADADITNLLLNAGASPNDVADSHIQVTALMGAARQGNAEMVEQLLLHGADPRRGAPLFWALHSDNSMAIIQQLLDEGADINQQDKNGNHLLCAVRQLNVAELLIRHGAAPKQRCSHGRTVLHMIIGAVRQPHKGDSPQEALIRRYIESGVDVSAVDNNGDTALHVVAKTKHKEAGHIAGLLIDAGIDLETRDAAGRTALDLATKAKNLPVIELLAGTANTISTSRDSKPPATR